MAAEPSFCMRRATPCLRGMSGEDSAANCRVAQPRSTPLKTVLETTLAQNPRNGELVQRLPALGTVRAHESAHQSFRSDVKGSTAAARRAGTYDAAIATAATLTSTNTNVS